LKRGSAAANKAGALEGVLDLRADARRAGARPLEIDDVGSLRQGRLSPI
jgi:hypothetical protein